MNIQDKIEDIELLLENKKDEFLKKIEKYNELDPPITLVFADYGEFIFDNMLEIDRIEDIFIAMEEYANSNNEILVAASLTGFIEQIVNSCDSDPVKWKALAALMGPKCIAHAEAWRDFTG